jgi:hypothetical protein
MFRAACLFAVFVCCNISVAADIDSSTLRGRVMVGYQGWFRCPGDAANLGWVHWSRNGRQISPETISVEMWPDLSEFKADEKFAAPGFTFPDGSQAYLYSSDNAAVVLRHFQWMRDYGIDGAWLQQFVVDLPTEGGKRMAPSRSRVLQYVADAAKKTGRVWAITYDCSGGKEDRLFDAITADWKHQVDAKIAADDRYLKEKGVPVVEIYGFFPKDAKSGLTRDVASKLLDFFASPGPYRAFVLGSGDWNWRKNADTDWRKTFNRLGAYIPWNVGNLSIDRDKVKHAQTNYWADDRKACDDAGMLWIPVIYPGFSWDNLKRAPAGSTEIPRRKGQFYWEQFHRLAEMKQTMAFVAMFDEVDEGTAIYKVTSSPPTQGHFVGLDGLPSDWYLRLTGEGTKMLCGERPDSADIPIKP